VKRNPPMVYRAFIDRTRWKIFPLVLVLVTGFAITGCDLPGINSDASPDQTTVDQPDTEDQLAEQSDDLSPDRQQSPDEAYDLDDQGESESQSTPVRIVEAGLQEPRTLNPVLVGDPLSEEISQLVFSGLVTVEPETGEPVPDLAESWEISEDGMTYRFDLRNVTWHDGQPFTAQDVVFTYDLMMNEQTRSPRYSRLVERITAVKAIDTHSVQFRLVGPYAPFLSTLATFGIVPQHILVNVLPGELITDPFGISSAVGTGPFELNRWDRGERILFEANADYFRTAPEIDQYEYRVVAEETDILDGLAHGSIDWARISPAQMGAASDLRDVRTVSIPSFEMVTVVLQLDPTKSKLFEDPAVREALMLALDRDAAVESIWHGHAEVAHGTLPPASWAYQRSDVRHDYDPTRAAELLTDAGWATSDDGIRMRDGIPLQFGVIANGDNPTRRALAQWLVESWREIGIEAHTQFETWGTVRDNITTSRDFDALVLGYRWDIDPDQHAMWASDSIPDAFNLGGYVNLEVDRLLDDALATADAEDRAEMYAQVQDLVMADLPALPIVFPDVTIAIGSRLQDVEPTAILVRNRATIAEWVPVIAKHGDEAEN
jgi:peptide/nickel transport system substrate-binding protein